MVRGDELSLSPIPLGCFLCYFYIIILGPKLIFLYFSKFPPRSTSGSVAVYRVAQNAVPVFYNKDPCVNVQIFLGTDFWATYESHCSIIVIVGRYISLYIILVVASGVLRILNWEGGGITN